MPQSVRLIDPPAISPLRKPYGISAAQIYTDTYVQLTPAHPEHKVYFSSDGRDPNPWSRVVAGEERTFKYRGPFRLRQGLRHVKAMSVSRKDKASSRVAMQAFDVINDVTSRLIVEEVSDEVDDSSTVVSVSSALETSDLDAVEVRGSPMSWRRGLGTSDVGRSRGGYQSVRSGVRSDVGRSLDSYRRDAKFGDMERDRQRYKDILDNTFLEELHLRRKMDEDLSEKYLASGYSSMSTSDVDSLFDDNYNAKHDAAYGRKMNESYSDEDTEVSNYFRSTSPDRMAARSPHRTLYSKGGDPPAFWSTATPRVTFPDDIEPQSSRRRLGASLSTGTTPRHHDQTRHSYDDTRYSSSTRYKTGDSILRPQTTSESYHKSPYRGSRTTPRTASYTPPRTTLDSANSGACRHPDTGRRSPLSDVGYHAAYSYGSRGYRSADDKSPDDWELVDIDAEFDMLDEENKKHKGSDAEHESESEDEEQSKAKEKKKKKKKDKESEEDEAKSDEDKDVDERVKKSKKDTENKKEKKAKDGKAKKESDNESGDERKMNKKKNKDKDSECEAEQKKEGKGHESETDDKKEKKNKEDKGSEDEKEKKKKKKDKDSGDEKERKNKKKDKDSGDEKKKKKDKDSDSEDDKEKKKKKKKYKKEKDSDSSEDDKKKIKINKDKKKDAPTAPQTVNRTMTTEPGALSFVNDSGTQINFWGTPPKDVMKKVGDMITPPPKKEVRVAANPETQALPSGKQSRPQGGPAITYPADSSESYPPDTSRTYTVSDSAPIARTQTQQEQHSIGGFFKRLFGKKEKKKEDPRPTVREEADAGAGGAGDKEAFDQIRQRCLSTGLLWEDPDFPAVDDSVYFNENPADGDIEWKRPGDISSDPEMFVGGASRFDVKQGVLGNCWLLAAVASLTTNEKILHKVVPPDQNFKDQYAGVFRFKFWQYGKWVEVCIDDRLPTCNGELIFMHSEQGNEFWSPLMEKAYAKLCGCYENLSGGLASEAMTDFTGGVAERFNFREELPDNMFQMMLKAYQRKSLMGCSIDAAPDEIEQELENGLIKGHAYSITAVRMLEVNDKMESLVRVRNPWGNDCEWTGAWSDQSEEWQDISEEVKESMGLQFDHDGEFWMSFKDFSTHFQRVEICHLSPDSLGSDDGSTMWTSKIINSAWRKNVTAGGCRNFSKTYYTNPQVRLQITDADDDDEEEIGTIIVGLMQMGRRKLRADGGGNLTIGYEIFSTDGKNDKNSLDKNFFKKSKPVTTSAYINMREVCTRHRLPPGDYCVVVTTFEPGEESDLLLRIYSEKPGNVTEMDEDTSIVHSQNMSMTQSAPSASVVREAEAHFKRYGGEDEEIDAFELRSILNELFTKDFEFAGFDLNMCKSMLAMKDLDHTGKLGLEEFKAMWRDLDHWKNIFKKFDEDKSGFFNSCELREALKHCGYQVSNATYQSVVMRFSDKDGNIRFDDFVGCVVKLATMFGIFNNQFKDGQASFSLDDFIQMTIYS